MILERKFQSAMMLLPKTRIRYEFVMMFRYVTVGHGFAWWKENDAAIVLVFVPEE